VEDVSRSVYPTGSPPAVAGPDRLACRRQGVRARPAGPAARARVAEGGDECRHTAEAVEKHK